MEFSDGIRLYSKLPKFKDARTVAEIDLGALRKNYKYLCSQVLERAKAAGYSPTPICVVKADAYGHGACGAVPVFLEEGCRFFAVSSIEEGAEVRNICRNHGVEARILVLGYTIAHQADILAAYGITATLPSLEYAERLSLEACKAGVKLSCHIKLDTGMNRLGFSAYESDVERTVAEIKKCTRLKGLKIEGIFSHFAEADDGSSELDGKTKLQAERFLCVVKRLEENGVKIPFRHICNSAAALRYPCLALDGVRLGIALYGSRPSEFFDLPIMPAMSFKTRISHIHRLHAGESVSYGGRYVAESDRLIATLPVGYADGFLRSYGGAYIKISCEKGSFEAPIVGRICMDQCMADVSEGAELGIKVGDTVTLFGDCPERLYRLAEKAGTIPYEVLCAVSSRTVRIYKEDGNVL